MSEKNVNMEDTRQDQPLLRITDLDVAFKSTTGMVPAVRGANLTIYPGQTVAIVGESGSGKSTTAAAVIGLLPGTGRVTGGTIEFDGRDITHQSEKEWVELRGSGIGMVPQDPMSNLNPVWRVGTQVKEALKANNVVPSSEVGARVAQVPEAGLPDAEGGEAVPHEFRYAPVLIAIGLAADPKPSLRTNPRPSGCYGPASYRSPRPSDARAWHWVLFYYPRFGPCRRTCGAAYRHASRSRGRIARHWKLAEPDAPVHKRLVSAAPSLASQQ